MNVHLENGARYRGKIHLSWFETRVATDQMLVAKFVASGFSDVGVDGSGSDRTAYGTWQGTTGDVAIADEHIVSVERIL